MALGSRKGNGRADVSDPLGDLGPSLPRLAGRKRWWLRLRRGRLPRGVRGQAIRDGERAAWSGQYDEWSFAPEAALPYFGQLDALCDSAVATGRVRAQHHMNSALTALSDDHRKTRVEGAATWSRLQTAARRRDRAAERERVSLETLDLIAGSSFSRLRVPQFGDDGEAVPDERQAAGDTVGPDDPDPGLAGPGDGAAQVPFGMPRPEQADWVDSTGPGRPGRRRGTGPQPRYVGSIDGRFAVLLPRWLRIFTLGLLAAVEIPIYHKVFGYFTPRDPILTWTFTLPVAAGMVLAPHLAGKLHRRRQEMPRERVIPYVTIGVMALWLTAGVMLGWLREKVLLVPITDPLTGHQISLAGNLHVTSLQMTALFASLILMSGTIAFMLGIADPHPVVAGYRDAVRAAAEAEDAYDAAVTAHAEAVEPIRRTPEEIKAASAAEAEHQEQALRAEYTAAAEAYLDAYSREMGDPNVTQATNNVRSGVRP
jgi:hypothetical protein